MPSCCKESPWPHTQVVYMQKIQGSESHGKMARWIVEKIPRREARVGPSSAKLVTQPKSKTHLKSKSLGIHRTPGLGFAELERVLSPKRLLRHS